MLFLFSRKRCNLAILPAFLAFASMAIFVGIIAGAIFLFKKVTEKNVKAGQENQEKQQPTIGNQEQQQNEVEAQKMKEKEQKIQQNNSETDKSITNLNDVNNQKNKSNKINGL